MDHNALIKSELTEVAANLRRVAEELVEETAAAAELIITALRSGGKILFCGNGGSAADAQHLATELTGRFETERRPLPGLALTTDTSLLTAVGNDYGFDEVFARQVTALGRPGDLLVAISTSGNSPNVLRAVEAAAEVGVKVIVLAGRDGGKLAKHSAVSVSLIVPAQRTCRIQEGHIALGHTLCRLVDEAFLSD